MTKQQGVLEAYLVRFQTTRQSSLDNRQGALANSPCLGCTHKEMRLLTSQRVNLQAVSQEQSRWVIVATSPRKGRSGNLSLTLWVQ